MDSLTIFPFQLSRSQGYISPWNSSMIRVVLSFSAVSTPSRNPDSRKRIVISAPDRLLCRNLACCVTGFESALYSCKP